jgi:hypothetical protein
MELIIGDNVEIAGIGPGIITNIEKGVPMVAYSPDGKLFECKEFSFDQLLLPNSDIEPTIDYGVKTEVISGITYHLQNNKP